MSYIKVDYYHQGLDMNSLCRNYRQNEDGDNVRMGNHAAAMFQIGKGVNRALARIPRYNFWMAQHFISNTSVGADRDGEMPLYCFQYNDEVPNARYWRTGIISIPHASDAEDQANASRYVGAADETTGAYNVNVTVPNSRDLFYAGWRVDRGAEANAKVEENIATYNGFTIMDVVAQDEQLLHLDTAVDQYVDPSQAKRGERVLADLAEECRSKFHAQRKQNLPLEVCWSAQTEGNVFIEPSVPSVQGMLITNSVMVNPLAMDINVRTADSPGFTCPAYLAGRGVEDETGGKRVWLECDVHAVDTGEGGIIRIVGPEHVADNYQDISWVDAGTRDWYTSSGRVYLNPQSPITDDSVNRNKIDIHVQGAGSDNNVVIYGLNFRISYE